MSVRNSTIYQVVLWFLTLVCLAAALYLGYLTFWGGSSPEGIARNAQQRYTQGQNAEQEQNWDLARLRYDEARILAQKGLDVLQKMAENRAISENKYKSLLGELNWIKARAIRDYHYAQAAGEGKRLAEIPDPVLREQFRPFALIPNSDDRSEAINAMRIAGNTLKSDNPEVLREAIRLEITLTPINWKFAEPLLQEALKEDPSNFRTRYFLARYEFDQPQEDGMTPTTAERKSMERVQLAREHLEIAKKNPVQYWRVIGLEAEILNWTVHTADARRLKAETRQAAQQQLWDLLFAEPDGAIARATRGEKFEHFGNLDSAGLLQLFRIATNQALAQARQPNGDVSRLRQVIQAAVQVVHKIEAETPLRQFLPQTLATLAELAATTQPTLSRADPTTWKQFSHTLEQLLAQAPPQAISVPQAKRQIAQLRVHEAIVALRQQDMEHYRQLLQHAQKLVEEGLREAENAGLSVAVLDEFHYDLADLKVKMGARREQITPHLSRLQNSNVNALRQRGQFLEAILLEREGKLERARQLLEPLATNTGDPQLAFRAQLLLANICMAVGEPLAALGYLRNAEPFFDKLEELPALDRAWIEDLTGGRELVQAQQVQANLAAAVQTVAKHLQTNPKQPLPVSQISAYLDAARQIIKKIRSPSFANRIARQALVEFHMRMGQREEADKLLTALATDYPDSVDVLRLRCRLLALPKEPGPSNWDPNGVAAADTLIRRFLKDYPNDRAARLFYAEWLLFTQRPQRAIEYLKDPTNFPASDQLAQRLLGLAYLRSGQRESAERLLSQLPNDPNLDLLLIQTATTREAGSQRLQEALRRYENQGRFRVYAAFLRLQDGQYEEAIRGFASAWEFSEVRSIARQGLLLALTSYLQLQPAKVRDLALQLLSELPQENTLYLVVADAALMLEDVGEPNDRWEATKTMYAAINKWEETALQQGTSRADIALTKARAHLLAGYPERARREALNSLAQNPTHGATLLLLVELSLMPPIDLPRAKEYLASAQKHAASDPRLPYVEARVREATGEREAVISLYRQLIQQQPDNPLPRSLLVNTLEKSNQLAAALAEARQWQAAQPDQLEAATTVVRLLVRQGSKDEARATAEAFAQRRLEALEKRWQEIQPPIPQAEREQRLQTTRQQLQLAFANAFHRGGDNDEASRRVRAILQQEPNHLGALLLLGQITIEQQRWDEAMTAYNAVLKVQPRHFIAGNNLAWILAEKLQQPEQALAIAHEIWKDRPGLKPVAPERLPADFLDTLGNIYSKLHRSELYPHMRTLFEAAVRRYPNDPRMYLYLAHAQAALGERSQALENYNIAIRLASDHCSLPPEQIKTIIDAATQARQKLQN